MASMASTTVVVTTGSAPGMNADIAAALAAAAAATGTGTTTGATTGATTGTTATTIAGPATTTTTAAGSATGAVDAAAGNARWLTSAPSQASQTQTQTQVQQAQAQAQPAPGPGSNAGHVYGAPGSGVGQQQRGRRPLQVLCGPLLNYKHMSDPMADDPTWHGSVLLVTRPTDTSPELRLRYVFLYFLFFFVLWENEKKERKGRIL